MIIKNSRNWFTLLFVWKGSILRKVLPQLIIITLFSVLVLVFHGKIYHYKVHLNPTIFTLIGLALAIFMAFCNTASYDRYWEGRKLWGTLVIDTRSLTRQVITFIRAKNKAEDDDQKYFVKMIAAFSWALNFQLRNKDAQQHLQRLLSDRDFKEVENKKFKPIAILDLMAFWLNQRFEEGKMDSVLLKEMDEKLNSLSNIVGGCERIYNTPLPFPYRLLLHRTVYLYCFWLPFGLVDAVGVVMPIIVLLICYTFVGLDALIQEISEPFGEEENDLALDSICTTIEFSINEQAAIPQERFKTSDHYFQK